MHASLFLHNFVSKSLSFIHKIRLKILLASVFSLMNDGRLTLTSLGRNLQGQAKVKNKIKSIDRLLGNSKLFKESFHIYKQLSKKLLVGATEAVILIDFSGCCTKEHYLFRASLIGKGRSITIYQEVHPFGMHDNSKIKSNFLKSLKLILPKQLKVTLITDAGFRTPWFKLVRSFGWDFVGRMRGNAKIQLLEKRKWLEIKDYFKYATMKPKYIGKALLSTAHEFPINLYVYNAKLHGRKLKRMKGRILHIGKQEQYSRDKREPWIIVSSLQLKAIKIINLYKKRMQIEQNFRDDKNERWGFGWRYGRTKNPERFSILMLIAYIASLVLWLIGRAAETKLLHKDYQANTSKKRTLSYLTLGKQVLKHSLSKISAQDICKAIGGIACLQTAY